jgi:hypothetical protein
VTGELFCVGGDYLEEGLAQGNVGIFLTSTDEWVTVDTPPAGYRSGVAYFNQEEWLITVGPSGSDFSNNSGVNWKKFSTEGFHAVKTGSTTGSVWATGANGKVAKLKF